MTTLYIAWQDPQTCAWHTVGKLEKEKNAYFFLILVARQHHRVLSHWAECLM
ncbi:MAG: hypothetical protein WBI40_00805 [Methylococcaceae bacterium]